MSEDHDYLSKEVAQYKRYMDAQSEIRYYEYSLRRADERLAERIMTEDTSDIVAEILSDEANLAKYKAVRAHL
jgi:hypothetical protein